MVISTRCIRDFMSNSHTHKILNGIYVARFDEIVETSLWATRPVRKESNILKLKSSYALMPCLFTGPKMFWTGPNILSLTKN